MSERTRESALIQVNREILEGFYEMTLYAPVISARTKPGQFVFIRIGASTAPLLRRPVSICGVSEQRGEISLLYKVVGTGTRMLASVSAGNELDCMGPIGTAFPLEGGNKPLVIAGGMGVAPLALLVRRLNEGGNRPSIYYGIKDADHAFLQQDLEVHGDLTLAAENESGLVTDCLPKTGNFTSVYACGPVNMLASVAGWAGERGYKGYVSLEEKMGCGIGACSGCAFPMRDGKGGVTYKKVCVDGPVFAMDEVMFHV